MAGEQLLAFVAELDQLIKLGAGSLVVVPRAVQATTQGDFRGWKHVVFPRARWNALKAEWQQLGLYGRPDPFAANDAVAAVIDANDSIQFAMRAPSAKMVSQLSGMLRADLQLAGIKVPAPVGVAPTKPPASKFSWGWIIGTVALGFGIGLVLYMTEKQNELPGEAA